MEPGALATDVVRALSAVRILSDEAVALRGVPRRCAAVLAPGSLDAPAGDPPVVRALTRLIYTELYARPRPAAPAPGLPSRELSVLLSAANQSTLGWDPGWGVERFEGEWLVVAKDGLRLRARPADVLPPAPVVGARVLVRLGKERRAISPGYYGINGDAVEVEPSAPGSVRVYFNLRLSGAIPFVEAVTSTFNRAGIPFRAKVVSSSAGFTRADAAVVYLGGEAFSRGGEVLRALAARLRSSLGAATPLFTKRLAPGVGLGEDPGGESFGLHRSGAVARALHRAWMERARSLGARLALAREALEAAGIDPARPYLTLGHPDPYVAWS